MAKLKKELEAENKLLLDRLEKLERMFNKTNEENEDNVDIIPMQKIIKVVSLYNGILNLKTSSRSDSVLIKFNFFGEEQPIFYSDLTKCISAQQRFFKEGFCMILDSKVVKAHYLDKDYENLLTRDEFYNFLSNSENEMREKYNKLPIQQKITLLEITANKVNENTADRNKVQLLSDITKQDIYELANKLQ